MAKLLTHSQLLLQGGGSSVYTDSIKICYGGKNWRF